MKEAILPFVALRAFPSIILLFYFGCRIRVLFTS